MIGLDLVQVLVIAPLGALALFGADILKEALKKRLAYRRLYKDPRVFVGARLAMLKNGGDEPLLDVDCYISKMGIGLMEVTVDHPGHRLDGCVMTFRGREFENLHPIFKG